MLAMAWLLVVLTCLATYRVTRLLVVDKITEGPRTTLYTWLCTRHMSRDTPDYMRERVALLSNIAHGVTKEPLLAYLITCVWCSSVWVGGLIVLAVGLTTDLPYPLLVWPVASAVTGFLASKEGD